MPAAVAGARRASAAADLADDDVPLLNDRPPLGTQARPSLSAMCCVPARHVAFQRTTMARRCVLTVSLTALRPLRKPASGPQRLNPQGTQPLPHSTANQRLIAQQWAAHCGH